MKKGKTNLSVVDNTDDFIMGPDIDLGSADSIDNYEDRAFTEEEIKAFYESVGMKYNKEEVDHTKHADDNF